MSSQYNRGSRTNIEMVLSLIYLFSQISCCSKFAFYFTTSKESITNYSVDSFINKPTKERFSWNERWKLIERSVNQGYFNSANIVTQNAIHRHTKYTINSLKSKHTLNVFMSPKNEYISSFRLIHYSLASFISCASHLVSISCANQQK